MEVIQSGDPRMGRVFYPADEGMSIGTCNGYVPIKVNVCSTGANYCQSKITCWIQYNPR